MTKADSSPGRPDRNQENSRNAMAEGSDPGLQSPAKPVDLLNYTATPNGTTTEVGYQRRSPARGDGSPAGRRSTPGRAESNHTTPRPGESGEGAGSSESPPDYQVFIRNFKRSYSQFYFHFVFVCQVLSAPTNVAQYGRQMV